jgi:hypothetical protein
MSIFTIRNIIGIFENLRFANDKDNLQRIVFFNCTAGEAPTVVI